MLHRLFIELDKGGNGAKITATILSPTDRITAAARGYGPEESPNKTNNASFSYGFSWFNAQFFENNEKIEIWNTPAAFLDIDLVYNDPYTAQSKTPFDQFDLYTSLTVSVPFLYNFNIISSGYLASWCLADNEVNQASNGITLHWDGFFTDKGSLLDVTGGRENLNFNPNSLDYTIQWRRSLSKSVEFSLKTHLGFTPWAMANYNGGVDRDDYNLYLIGGNFKLFLELRQKKEEGAKNGHALALSMCFYDTWRLYDSPHYDNNTLFLFSKIAYSFPLTNSLSLYVSNTFQLMHTRLINDEGPEHPDSTRWHNNAQIGVKYSFF
jgi:hypothetical protein